jgi:hypothetical protein
MEGQGKKKGKQKVKENSVEASREFFEAIQQPTLSLVSIYFV